MQITVEKSLVHDEESQIGLTSVKSREAAEKGSMEKDSMETSSTTKTKIAPEGLTVH